jgi:hypothetical protein
MFKKIPESAGNVLGFQVTGEVTKEDYKDLTTQVQAIVDEHGSINLLLDLERFKAETPAAWREDLKFGRTYHKKIAKLAIVGDKSWQHLLATLADPFYARESRFFHTADHAEAWAWLRSA